MRLFSLLASCAVLPQGGGWQRHSDDPLHQFVVQDVGTEDFVIESVTDFDGTLHVWAQSEETDPRLSIDLEGRNEPLEDDDSGGGNTAYIAFEVSAGQALAIWWRLHRRCRELSLYIGSQRRRPKQHSWRPSVRRRS